MIMYNAKYFFDNYKYLCDNYKSFSAYDKLTFIQHDGVAHKPDRREIALYLNAVRNRNTEYVNYFESFGKTPREMAYNKIQFDKYKPCKFILNSFGWIKITEILENKTQFKLEFN